MKLTQFRDLLAVVQTGSLRAASRHLGIAQPVITRSIRELESELGQALFERHSKGVSLTPVGERFVRRIEGVQEEVRRAKEEVAQSDGGDIGEVSIGLSPLAVMSLLGPAMATFNKRYPKAVTKVTQTLFKPIEDRMGQGLLDFWIGPLQREHLSQRFAVEILMPHRRRIVARPGHPLLAAGSLDDLVGARWVRPPLSDRVTQSDLEVVFQQRGLPPPEVVVESSSMDITLITVANTDLLTLVPDQVFGLMRTEGFCAPLENIAPLQADPICMVRRNGLPLTPLAEKLSDLMRKAASNFSLGLETRRDATLVRLL